MKTEKKYWEKETNISQVSTSRREFVKKSGVVLLGSSFAYPVGVFTETKQAPLKIGLIGCGGRGTGAASQAIQADPNVVLTAMGDVFEDRLEKSYAALLKMSPEKVKVDKTHKFIGFDAYKKVLESDVDVVLLTTPPGFRPAHFEAAVKAGKHIFCEKPVAVDAPGVRKVLAAAKKAKEKNLSVVSGFCFRYHFAKRAFFGRVLKGDIGEIQAITTYRNGGEAWYKERQPDWTEMTYQLRNWYYYNWLSGDFIVEQSVHSLDMMSWAMGDVMPKVAMGNGGRQVRTDRKYGHIFDHFAIEFEYANGAKGYHFTRQQAGTATQNTVEAFGNQGTASLKVYRNYDIKGKENWSYDGEMNNMYQTQHDEFFASIRNGTPINNGERFTNSTMLAIWARMIGYTGQKITWEEAFNSTESLGPNFDDYDWDLVWEMPPVAIPGKTKLI